MIGLEHQKSEIDAKVTEIRRRLRGLGGASKAESAPMVGVGSAPAKVRGRKKRVLSPAARKRIADATKKRWAEYRAKKAAASAPKRPVAKKGRKKGSATATAATSTTA